mgnify:CR=1 FL=1
MKTLLLILLAVVVILYSAFVWGFVVSKFYLWFILPVFPSLPHFSILQFIGFLLFVRVIMPKHYSWLKDEYEDTSKIWTGALLDPWVTLAIGYLIHCF